MKNIIDLTNKTIVITGAASGIGRETAITISRVGAKVVMLDIFLDGLNETLQLLEGKGHSIYVVDLSNVKSLKTLVERIFEKEGVIDGLVHCAGISSRKPLNVLSKVGFDKLMDINFFSFVELVKHFSKKGRMNECGSIVVMSSISSIHGYKAKTEYCVSKAALDASVRCLASELASKQIRVNSIMPGEVNTPMGKKAREITKDAGAEINNQPLGITEPYEVANIIAFLLSDATKTITGSSILIDGGVTLT